MGTGYIKLHRSILNNALWEEKPFSSGQAWVDLILMANYKDKKTLKDGKIQTFARGTVTTSLYALSDRWGWDRKKVRRFLKLLEVEQMVSLNGTTRGTIISLVNYGNYQDCGTTDGTTPSPTPSPTVSPTPSPILNKGNKYKNFNKGKYKGATTDFIQGSLEDDIDDIELIMERRIKG